jgi:transposase InsO family protein
VTLCGGVNRHKKGAGSTLAALRSIRWARPDGAPTYVVLDNLSAHRGETIRRWARKNRVEPCFTPTYAAWVNPREAHMDVLPKASPQSWLEVRSFRSETTRLEPDTLLSFADVLSFLVN